MNKNTLYLLVVLNIIVLLGQLWPEGAPPFARIVNIITLFCNVAVFGAFLRTHKKTGS
jgi:hypothetical protein